MLHDSMHMKCSGQANPWRQKVSVGFGSQRLGGEWNGNRVSFWGDENVLNLIVVLDVLLCEYVKIL